MAKSTNKTSTTKKNTVAPKKEPPAEVETVVTIPVETAVEAPVASTPVVPQVVYANPGDQMMTVIHLDLGANYVSYGNGKQKVFKNFGDKWSISVREFEQEFAPSTVGTLLLQQRLLAVGDDCPQETRDRLDLNYGKKELLTLKQKSAIYTMPEDELVDLFNGLCYEHKVLVARCFADDFENGGFHCERSKIKRLNDASKAFVQKGERGMFAPLLEQITHAEEEDY